MEKSVKYILYGLLVAYLAKALILGPSITEVLMAAILASLTVFHELKLKSKEVKAFEAKIKALEDHTSSQDKIVEDIKNSIAGVKAAAGFRTLQSK